MSIRALGLAAVIGAAMLLAPPAEAHRRGNFYFGFSSGPVYRPYGHYPHYYGPRYYPPPPVYYAPPPIYYAPPRPYYYPPAPNYYYPPLYSPWRGW